VTRSAPSPASSRLTAEDRVVAEKQLRWFTDQGGRVDLSRLPATKAPVTRFFLDDERHIWVDREVSDPDRKTSEFDLFDPEGRYLGPIEMPFWVCPFLLVRGGALYAVVHDELEVEYLAKARIERP
jgi:hypothetical protein